MGDDGAAKKGFYRSSALGAVVVILVLLAVQLAMPDFPGTSPASMAFFGALALAAVANIVAASTWIFMRVPAPVPVKRWMVALFVSRISFAWAMFLIVVIAVMGSVIDRQLAKPLFRTLIVAMMLGAFWLMATSTVTIVGILWSRDRKSASPSDQSPST